MIEEALFDKKDYNHATDSSYRNYRSEASRMYGKRSQLLQQSQHAYQRGDKQKAHMLSEQSKQCLQQAEDYNKKAAEHVFVKNNADSAEDEIDLHGLYVKEARWILQKRLSECMRTNQKHLKVIVGKGLHSQNGVARLKPAIEVMCLVSRLNHHIDRHNPGVLIIDFESSPQCNIPSHWDTHTIGNQGYQSTQQTQPSDQQQPPQNQNKVNPLFKLLLKLVCNCLK